MAKTMTGYTLSINSINVDYPISKVKEEIEVDMELIILIKSNICNCFFNRVKKPTHFLRKHGV